LVGKVQEKNVEEEKNSKSWTTKLNLMVYHSTTHGTVDEVKPLYGQGSNGIIRQ